MLSSKTVIAVFILIAALLSASIPSGVVMAAAVESSDAVAAKIAPEISTALASGTGPRSAIVLLSEQADLSGASHLRTKKEKGRFVYAILRAIADRTQPSVAATLAAQEVRTRPLYIANALLIEKTNRTALSSALINSLAQRSDVGKIISSAVMTIDSRELSSTSISPGIGTGYNVTAVHAPEVWAKGFTGQGIVYGNIDSGVAFEHEALINQYRGRIGPGSYDHNYNWWDATAAASAQPVDGLGHGTHTMGTAVGDAPNNHIGIAPGAQWMACRAFVEGSTSTDIILECLQFMLAPWDLNGQNPNPDKAPDVIGNSYSGGVPPDVAPLFATAFNNLRAAGIFSVAAAGNTGPGCRSANGIPQAIPGVTSVGATDQNGRVADFSSRGPGVFADVNSVKPDVAAPGVSIVSSIPDGGYAQLNGTSMAAPAVGGIALLVWSARPELIGDPDDTGRLLAFTSRPMLNLGCNSLFRPNYYYGYGNVNAESASLSKNQWPIDRLRNPSSGAAPQ